MPEAWTALALTLKVALWATALNLVLGVAVGFAMDRTGGKGYTDDTAPQTVAAFLLTRKEQWFFGVTQSSDTMALSTAALLLSDR